MNNNDKKSILILYAKVVKNSRLIGFFCYKIKNIFNFALWVKVRRV